jgi:hypothetical protein
MSNKVSIPLTNYEYEVLKNNYIISACCKMQLNAVTLSESGAELLLPQNELKKLIGYVLLKQTLLVKKVSRKT